VKGLVGIAVLLVVVIAGTVSFMHIERLALHLGQPTVAAWLLPLSVDGTVCAASAALLWSAREAIPAPRMARPMLGMGVAATLAANADFGAAGIVLSALPAIAFAGSAEIAFGMVRKSVQTAAEPDSNPVTETAAVAAVIPLKATADNPAAPAVEPRLASCDRADIPDIVPALSPFASRHDHEVPSQPVWPAGGRRSLGMLRSELRLSGSPYATLAPVSRRRV